MNIYSKHSWAKLGLKTEVPYLKPHCEISEFKAKRTRIVPTESDITKVTGKIASTSDIWYM